MSGGGIFWLTFRCLSAPLCELSPIFLLSFDLNLSYFWCSWLLVALWRHYKNSRREGDLYHLEPPYWRFVPFQHLEMAVPVTELTAQQHSYFESERAHTSILRSIHVLKDLSESSEWKEIDLYRLWWPCWRFSAQKRAKPKPPITEFSVLKPPKNPTDLPFQHKNES